MNRWSHLFIRMFKRPKNERRLDFTAKKQHPIEHPWVRTCIAAGLVAAVVLMLPTGADIQFSDMQVNSISPRRIIAPFSYEILKPNEEYQADCEIARRDVRRVFMDQRDRFEDVNHLNRFLNEVEMVRKQPDQTLASFTAARDTLMRRFDLTGMESPNWQMLMHPLQKITDPTFEEMRSVLGRILQDALAFGVLDHAKKQIENDNRQLVLIQGNEEVVYDFNAFYDLTEARAFAMERINQKYSSNGALSRLGYAILRHFLRPNLIFEESIYNERVQDAVNRVPLSRGFVIENEKIVDKNEKVTPEIRNKLTSLSSKMAEKGMLEGGFHVVLPYVGKVLFVAAFLLIFVVFVRYESPVLLTKTKSVVLLALIILLVALSTWAIARLETGNPSPDPFMTSAIGAMLFSMIFNEKIGYAGALFLSIIVAGILGAEFNIFVISLFASVIGILIIKGMKDRGHLVRAMMLMIASYAGIFMTMGLIRYVPFRDILQQWPLPVVNGIATPLFAFLMIAIFEKTFDITTDFRLLELSNLNHPLLKRMSLEATGTYHHSIIVGNLAEAAAQAVGANSLLARVGSYYHDIGKLEKAEYFVENIRPSENPHQKLTPRMSALILSNHVKRGLELGDVYGLPSSIKDIMVQHHGKTVMSFFYQKALSKKSVDEVNADDYRYPGPKPQTKEAAIVMMADTIEAAARAHKEPTHSRLKGLVDTLVDQRFQEGEFDESPLTLRDLDRIKESFLKILAGIFHARIEYPEKDNIRNENIPKETKAPDED